MCSWWGKSRDTDSAAEAESGIREKYGSFKDLLTLNNDCLELLAGLQEDLQYVPPRAEVLGARVPSVFDKVEAIVGALEKLLGKREPILRKALASQRREVEGAVAARYAMAPPRLSVWLSEIDAAAAWEVGGKAAALGEIRNHLGLPVPEGFVITTESYWRFVGIPFWRDIRDAMSSLDVDDVQEFQPASARLADLVMGAELPRAVEVAVEERAKALRTSGLGLAVRSSAVGEGETRTFAGQFNSIINVPPALAADAFKQVVASRFSARSLSYRLTTGCTEVESPMAVLFMPTLRARAAGILYTRDPGEPRKDTAWVAATRGLALDVASGQTPADLFVVSRRGAHTVLERRIVKKESRILAAEGGGLTLEQADPAEASRPSLQTEDLQILAEWAVLLEDHFKAPQDVEWLLDELGDLWILQSRPLSTVDPKERQRSKPRGEPLVTGGHTVYPGRVSGPAYVVEELQDLGRTPEGALVVMRRPSPEIVGVFPRIAGLVAESGNITGHGAALLREFKVPSVFQMKGVLDRVKTGDPISLDALQPRVFTGLQWPAGRREAAPTERYKLRSPDAIGRCLLKLNLVDPSSMGFRPSGCRSTHDVLRYCHEKAIEAMFAVGDVELERGARSSKRLVAPIPVNLHVLDLGGGLDGGSSGGKEVVPEQITSVPFQALWRGVNYPGVQWNRDMGASLRGIASVMATSFSSHSPQRALGEKSYLLVADEYMNLNSRLAYHYSLVDACVSDVRNKNYISFRFAGGGASRQRRILRACFIETCLSHYGFNAERRGDIVNAWFKKGGAEETGAKLDILGRLLASSGQLDMYMGGEHAMRWYVQQFVAGNYRFQSGGTGEPDGTSGGGLDSA
jgi:pyruvate, water dikinase